MLVWLGMFSLFSVIKILRKTTVSDESARGCSNLLAGPGCCAFLWAITELCEFSSSLFRQGEQTNMKGSGWERRL